MTRPADHMRHHRRLLLAGCAVLTLAVWLMSKAGDALVVREPLDNPDAIVSLASHEWERLPLAARLATLSPSSRVVLTQPDVVTRFNCDDCANRVARLERAGIASNRVDVVPTSEKLEGTYGEAMAVADFAKKAGLRRLVIVTSPLHSRRALAIFRRVFQGTGVMLGIEPAGEFAAIKPHRWWMTADGRWYVAYEWAAAVYYSFKYGIFTF